MPEIGVVVPVYKVEKYLKRCVESILNQTFADFVLVLVDDGSPDDCPRMCDEFALQDSRILVIHQNNGGLSAARNAGIDWIMNNSRCNWLTFVDSDDWVSPNFLEVLRDAALSRKTAVSMCGYESTEGADPAIRPEQLCAETVRPEEFYLQNRVNATVAWGKLYARNCFEKLRYPVGKIHEDEYITYQILFAQEKLVFVPAPMYAYFYNEQGITKREWKPQRMDIFMALEQQINFFRQRGDEQLMDNCLHSYMRNAYGQMMETRTCSHPEQYREEEKFLAARTKELLKQCHKRGCVSFESDFSVLTEFYPVRTKLYLWYQAALRRLKLIKNQE